jgi:hypothetical protein
MLSDLAIYFSKWRKKHQNVYINAGDVAILSSATPVPQAAQLVPTPEPVSIVQLIRIPFEMDTTTSDETGGIGSAEAQAVATGVDPTHPTGRKGRVRKNGGVPRAAIAKKKKEPKPPRNPFRRSDTGKLQLKNLQMSKRVETMGPRVAALRERLDTMESRLVFISGKLKLVKEELSARSVTTEDEGMEEIEVGAIAPLDEMESVYELAPSDEVEQPVV